VGLYWMQKVSIILAVIIIDRVTAAAEFVTSAALSTWCVRSEVERFGGWKDLFCDPVISLFLTFLSRFRCKFCDLYASIHVTIDSYTWPVTHPVFNRNLASVSYGLC